MDEDREISTAKGKMDRGVSAEEKKRIASDIASQISAAVKADISGGSHAWHGHARQAGGLGHSHGGEGHGHSHGDGGSGDGSEHDGEGRGGGERDEEAGVSAEEAYAEMVGKFVRAGEVCRKGRVKARELAKPGVKFLDLAEGLEKFLREQDAGCALAFPVNLGANNNAAHYTPTADDATVVGENDVLKIDFGTHCDGFIVDNSITVDFGGGHGKLLEAADQALQDALSVIRPGVDSKEVGRAIEEAIAKRGLRPIENLCGHAISHFDLHAGVEIPNVARNGGHIFEEGEVFAIEPFATDGDGRVREDGTHTEIYSLVQAKPVRLQASRQLLSIIASDYATLPFAKRWLQEFPSLNLALNDLTKQGMLHSYSLLREREGALVSQAETTVIIEADGVKVLVE